MRQRAMYFSCAFTPQSKYSDRKLEARKACSDFFFYENGNHPRRVNQTRRLDVKKKYFSGTRQTSVSINFTT